MRMPRPAQKAAPLPPPPKFRPAAGPDGIALLRRVRASVGPYHVSQAEEPAAGRLIYIGYLRRDRMNALVLCLTGAGQAFLDGLVRAL